MGAVENDLKTCVHTEVDIEALERLMGPENEEVSIRYVLKYSTRGGSDVFQHFDFVSSRRRWLESQGKKATKQGSWQNEWRDI